MQAFAGSSSLSFIRLIRDCKKGGLSLPFRLLCRWQFQSYNPRQNEGHACNAEKGCSFAQNEYPDQKSSHSADAGPYRVSRTERKGSHRNGKQRETSYHCDNRNNAWRQKRKTFRLFHEISPYDFEASSYCQINPCHFVVLLEYGPSHYCDDERSSFRQIYIIQIHQVSIVQTCRAWAMPRKKSIQRFQAALLWCKSGAALSFTVWLTGPWWYGFELMFIFQSCTAPYNPEQ